VRGKRKMYYALWNVPVRTDPKQQKDATRNTMFKLRKTKKEKSLGTCSIKLMFFIIVNKSKNIFKFEFPISHDTPVSQKKSSLNF